MKLPAKKSRLKDLNNSKITNTLKYRNMSQWESNTDIQTMPDERMLLENIRTS